MKNTTWSKRWSSTNESDVATRVCNGITEVRYPDCGDIFRSEELDEMASEDYMMLCKVVHEG